MADLYTITLRRQHIVSTFDAKGNKSGESTTFMEEKHHDLPAQTVASYRKLFPDAFVSAEIAIREPSHAPRRSEARTSFSERAPDRQRRPHTASAGKREASHVPGYADAINAAVRREAQGA